VRAPDRLPMTLGRCITEGRTRRKYTQKYRALLGHYGGRRRRGDQPVTAPTWK